MKNYLARQQEDTLKAKPMKTDISKESVKKLLDHWIEHNESHSRSFRERAVQVSAISEKAAQDINEAAALMDRCTEVLRKAMKDL
jgi:hypothetical protein